MNPTRRDVLAAGLPALAAAALPLSFAGAAPGAGRRAGHNVLVVLHLVGGNDGLNTVVPHADPAYYAARPTLAVRDGLAIDDTCSFHPALAGLKSLYDRGQVAIVQGCGHPCPTRSHYRAAEIWQTARTHEARSAGWLGKYLDRLGAEAGAGEALAWYAGPEVPQALVGEADIGRVAALGEDPADALLGGTCLSGALGAIAGRIAGGAAARVYCVPVNGFDTHANQAAAHAGLLGRVGDALHGFQNRLEASGHAGRVLTLCFSEFGRRVHENGAGGTDHGAAAPLLLVGAGVRGGVHGRAPSLEDLEDGDLRYTTDFRRVYATVLERWLGTDSASVLGARFEGMDLLS